MHGCVLGHDECLELQTLQERALITVNVFFINCETNGCYSKEINGVCVCVCMETFFQKLLTTHHEPGMENDTEGQIESREH